MQKTSPENSVGWWTEEDLAEKETDSMTERFFLMMPPIIMPFVIC